MLTTEDRIALHIGQLAIEAQSRAYAQDLMKAQLQELKEQIQKLEEEKKALEVTKIEAFKHLRADIQSDQQMGVAQDVPGYRMWLNEMTLAEMPSLEEARSICP
jgi:excinuclease UvrABC helicase subunit UvrB